MLFQRVYATDQRIHPLSGSTLVSLALHGALLGGAAWYMGGVEQMHQAVTQGMFFFAPPPTAQAGPQSVVERISFADLRAPDGLGDALGSELGSIANPEVGGEGDRLGRTLEEAAGLLASRDLPSIFARNADSIYLESQVDNPVAFDERSMAPSYPDSLRVAGVEGAVMAQFVVDTTGRVELASFVLLESSHGRFTQSVRDALPGMLFRPAEINGHKIKQLVQLPFIFRLEPQRTALNPPLDVSQAADRSAPPPLR